MAKHEPLAKAIRDAGRIVCTNGYGFALRHGSVDFRFVLDDLMIDVLLAGPFDMAPSPALTAVCREGAEDAFEILQDGVGVEISFPPIEIEIIDIMNQAQFFSTQ